MPRDIFSRFAIVGYKDDTGIGRQCHNMQSVLGIGYHLVCPSTRLEGHALDAPRERLLSATASITELEAVLQDIEGIIVIERNKWHPELFKTAKRLGKRKRLRNPY